MILGSKGILPYQDISYCGSQSHAFSCKLKCITVYHWRSFYYSILDISIKVNKYTD